MQVLFPVAFISSSGSQILGAQIVRINEGGDKLVISTTKSNFSLSHLPVLVIDTTSLSHFHHHHHHHHIFIVFPPFHLHIVDTISTLHRNHIDFTWTKHRSHIDPTSTKHRPFMDPTSSLHRPYNDPTSIFYFNTGFVNSEAIYHYHHISFVPPPAPCNF